MREGGTGEWRNGDVGVWENVISAADECVDDGDCSNQGSCVDLQGVSLPRRQCFCDAGYYGSKCDRGTCTVVVGVVHVA